MSKPDKHTKSKTAIYKLISVIYIISIVFIFIGFPKYTGFVFASMIFWLSLRGVVYKKLLVGASFPYKPVQGDKTRILSIFLLLLSIAVYYWIFALSDLNLNILAAACIFIYLPLIMSLGTYLKKRD